MGSILFSERQGRILPENGRPTAVLPDECLARRDY
jgi:hypothetical protein